MAMPDVIEALSSLVVHLRRSPRRVRIDDSGGMFSGLGEDFRASCLVDREARVMVSATGARRFEAGEESGLGVGVLKAGVDMIDLLELDDEIEDILITTTHGIEVLRPLDPQAALFVHVRMDRAAANLPIAKKRAVHAQNGFL